MPLSYCRVTPNNISSLSSPNTYNITTYSYFLQDSSSSTNETSFNYSAKDFFEKKRCYIHINLNDINLSYCVELLYNLINELNLISRNGNFLNEIIVVPYSNQNLLTSQHESNGNKSLNLYSPSSTNSSITSSLFSSKFLLDCLKIKDDLLNHFNNLDETEISTIKRQLFFYIDDINCLTTSDQYNKFLLTRATSADLIINININEFCLPYIITNNSSFITSSPFSYIIHDNNEFNRENFLTSFNDHEIFLKLFEFWNIKKNFTTLSIQLSKNYTIEKNISLILSLLKSQDYINYNEKEEEKEKNITQTLSFSNLIPIKAKFDGLVTWTIKENEKKKLGDVIGYLYDPFKLKRNEISINKIDSNQLCQILTLQSNKFIHSGTIIGYIVKL